MLSVFIFLTFTATTLPPAASDASFATEYIGSSITREDERDLKRILRLADGSIVRARSRCTNGKWELRDGPRWSPLEQQVASWRLEREVLGEAKARAANIGVEPARRTEFARWMIGEGLTTEAFEQLDGVLTHSPDYGPALALVREAELSPLDTQGEMLTGAARLNALVKAGASVHSGPARRAAAVEQVATFAHQVNLQSMIKAELSTMQHGRRAFATLLARRLLGDELAPELANRAILDGHAVVREGAAAALLALDDVRVIAPAINALASKNANVRGHAAEALGNMAYPAAVQPLMTHLAALQAGGGPRPGVRANTYLGLQTAYVMDYDVEIAQGASIADPIVGTQASGSVFDVRAVVQMTKVVELRKTMRALSQLTGAQPGKTPADWIEWWRANEAGWQSKDHVQTSAASRR